MKKSMKKSVYVFYFVASLLYMHTYTAENQYHVTFHNALTSDANNIVKIIDEQAHHDSTRIVVLPKQFRLTATKQAIDKKQLYVAKYPASNNDIIAFKKLFLIKKEKEYNRIATDEIRCTGPTKMFVSAHIFDSDHRVVTPVKLYETSPFSFKNSAVIYFGGDYTVPEHRNKGINSQLTDFAFDAIIEETMQAITTHNLTHLILLYGLTAANAGEGNGEIDRTPSIVRSFKRFGQKIVSKCNHTPVKNNSVQHIRYESFMPTFNPEDNECKPLPDDQAIAGYGNILIFPLP